MFYLLNCFVRTIWCLVSLKRVKVCWAKIQGFPAASIWCRCGYSLYQTLRWLAIVACTLHSTCIYTAELSEPKGWGGSVPPGFGKSVNPISTRGTDYAHYYTTCPLPPGISKLPTALHCTGKAECGNLHRARFMCSVHTIKTFGVREFKIITLLFWTHAHPCLYSIASPKLTYNSENWDSPLAWCEEPEFDII